MDVQVIRLMADYQCFPLWRPGGDPYNVDPASLPISADLVAALEVWAAEFDATLNQDDPASSGFADVAAGEAFAERGAALAQRLAAALGPSYRVEHR